jgi:hypothetical protein
MRRQANAQGDHVFTSPQELAEKENERFVNQILETLVARRADLSYLIIAPRPAGVVVGDAIAVGTRRGVMMEINFSPERRNATSKALSKDLEQAIKLISKTESDIFRHVEKIDAISSPDAKRKTGAVLCFSVTTVFKSTEFKQ